MDKVQLARELAGYVRSVVRPLIGKQQSRKVTGTACSGDSTFSIDDAAEEAVVSYIKDHDLNVAYYTEDAGLRTFGSPEATLIIDPIDGTRGAMAGFECCVVSVAVADYLEDVRMTDVCAGCIYEIKDDRIFLAQKGRGVKIIEGGAEVPVNKSSADTLERAAWTAEITGRPAALVARFLGEAIDASSVRGGFFVLNSTAYSLTRLVTGQLGAVIDVGARIATDVPGAREAFLNAGFGAVVSLFPYDFASAALIAMEAGCTVTDAYGRELDNVRLLDSSEANIQSIVAASNPMLHSGS